MALTTKLQFWIACLGVSINLGLLGSSLAALAQPASPEPSPIEDNPAAVPPSSSWITFPPLFPSCPLPPIPTSEIRTEGVAEFPTESRSRRSVSSSYTRGDRSDADVKWRILELLEEKQPDAAIELASQIDDEFKRSESLLDIFRYYVQLGQLE